jgi:hypothetical protein
MLANLVKYFFVRKSLTSYQKQEAGVQAIIGCDFWIVEKPTGLIGLSAQISNIQNLNN